MKLRVETIHVAPQLGNKTDGHLENIARRLDPCALKKVVEYSVRM